MSGLMLSSSFKCDQICKCDFLSETGPGISYRKKGNLRDDTVEYSIGVFFQGE